LLTLNRSQLGCVAEEHVQTTPLGACTARLRFLALQRLQKVLPQLHVVDIHHHDPASRPCEEADAVFGELLLPYRVQRETSKPLQTAPQEVLLAFVVVDPHGKDNP
ncbi:hypothetical protein HK102_011732, partial [Quaeritorhiza haematococci]